LTVASVDRRAQPRGEASRPALLVTPRLVALYCVVGVAFVLLATANAAGYRYGVSDQAFYIPVVVRALEPAAFPRDAAVIDAQGRLMLADELIASLVRQTGVSLDTLFFVAYLLSLGLTWAALVAIGARIYTSTWGIVALGAAFTLRHRIPRTSANSFEPYFHPRMLAFAICLLAIAGVQRRKYGTAIVLVGVSGLVHITTALWFSILIGIALAVLEPRLRRAAIVIAGAAIVVGAWAFTVGPMRTRMDDLWLQAVASKDSLFASQWPAWAWIANFAMFGALWWAHAHRRARGQASAEDNALVWGATAVVGVFVLTFPLVVARVAFPVQLQIARLLAGGPPRDRLRVVTPATGGSRARCRHRDCPRVCRAGCVRDGSRTVRSRAVRAASSRLAMARRDALAGHGTPERACTCRPGSFMEVRQQCARCRRTRCISRRRQGFGDRDLLARRRRPRRGACGSDWRLLDAHCGARAAAGRAVRPQLRGHRGTDDAAARLRKRAVSYLPVERDRAIELAA
jgi:hypothetical protein